VTELIVDLFPSNTVQFGFWSPNGEPISRYELGTGVSELLGCRQFLEQLRAESQSFYAYMLKLL
jgi:hypothetical protein